MKSKQFNINIMSKITNVTTACMTFFFNQNDSKKIINKKKDEMELNWVNCDVFFIL